MGRLHDHSHALWAENFHNSLRELAARLDELPTELSDLYADMWSRVNGKTKAYRQASAHYINLLMDTRNVNRVIDDMTGNCSGVFIPYSGESLTLFEIMAATTKLIDESVYDQGVIPEPSTLDQWCCVTRDAVTVRCAGLLDFVPESSTHSEAGLWENTKEQSRLLPHLRSNLVFIHRTAYDFMTETDTGQLICSYDPMPPAQRYLQLAKGSLVQDIFYRGAYFNQVVHRILTLVLTGDGAPQAENLRFWK